MEWWAWIAWAAAIVTGVSGLVLGIRAERRATRYEPRWVFSSLGSAVQVINRTGEDATKVTVGLFGADIRGRSAFDLVENNTTVEVYPVQSGPTGGFNVNAYVEWTRHATGRRYSYPKKRPDVPI